MIARRALLLAGVLAGVAACEAPPPPQAIVVRQPALVVPGPPPPAQAELLPPPAGVAGTVWMPGHWRWSGQSPQPWEWVAGRYAQAPMGQRVWVPGAASPNPRPPLGRQTRFHARHRGPCRDSMPSHPDPPRSGAAAHALLRPRPVRPMAVRYGNA